jgi:hypothetical protein
LNRSAAVGGGNTSSTEAYRAACGEGYAGTACATCARGFYAFAGTCAACPSANLVDQVLALARFGGGLLAAGALLLVAAARALNEGGPWLPPWPVVKAAAAAVGVLLV